MLSRLLVVRLKAAEHALRCGRLDEAYRLATARTVRRCRTSSITRRRASNFRVKTRLPGHPWRKATFCESCRRSLRGAAFGHSGWLAVRLQLGLSVAVR